MKEINVPPVATPYQRELALVWPVSWWHAPDQSTCRCVSDPRKQRHEIWLADSTVRAPEPSLADIVHELCHLYLAERVDAAFSTVWFSDRWNKLSRADPVRFGQAAQMLYLAWCQVDIWVNDLRHSRWPEFTAADHSSFAQGVMFLLLKQEESVLARPETLLGLTQYQAEQERHSLSGSPDLFAVLLADGKKVGKDIRRLARNFSSLPRLQYNAAEDLKILETSIAQTARQLEFPINPRLISEEGMWVWDLG